MSCGQSSLGVVDVGIGEGKFWFADLRGSHEVRVTSAKPGLPASPRRSESPPLPVEVEGDIHYEVSEILDAKLDRRYRTPLRYYVRWSGYEGTDEEFSWVGADDIAADELVTDFHDCHPKKPKPSGSPA